MYGPAGTGGTRRIVQNGREVYRFAVNVMGESAARAVEGAVPVYDSIAEFELICLG